MSKATDLLNSLTDEQISMYSANSVYEGNIIINPDRSINVPHSLRRIAVQFDHNIETVTFECPRYWDGHDMSRMAIYINYKRPDNHMASYPAYDIIVDETNPDIMHFKWTIELDVTQVKGKIAFLVCVKQIDDNGVLSNHWSSELCTDMSVSEGMECDLPDVTDTNPDFVSLVLQRLSVTEQLVSGFDARLTGIEDAAGDLGNKADKYNTLHGGFEGGMDAKAEGAGGAVGKEAYSGPGGAVGETAWTETGGAVGFNTKTSGGFAGGEAAKTVDSDGTPIDAIQLGSGTNEDEKTLQVYDYKLMDAEGNIPSDRLKNGMYPEPEAELGIIVNIGGIEYELARVNTEYILGERTGINLHMPMDAKSGDMLYIMFDSGETPTEFLYVEGDYSCVGLDDFVPETFKTYEIYGKFTGDYWLMGYSEYDSPVASLPSMPEFPFPEGE